MDFFEDMLRKKQQEIVKEDVRFENTKNQQQSEELLAEKLKSEGISAFKSGEHVVVELPIGYLVIYSFIDAELNTCFSLISECKYDGIVCADTPSSIDREVQIVKDVIEDLAERTARKDPPAEVDWTWFYQLKEEAEE